MKYFVLFTLAISTTILCCGQNNPDKENDWAKMQLKGKVHILEEKILNFTTTYYFSKNGYIEKIVDENKETFINYDTLGNKIEEITYSKVNGQSNLIKSVTFKNDFPQYIQGFNQQEEKTWKTEFLYTNNKISKEIEYDNNQIHSYFEYYYDDRGNKTEIKKFNAKNELKLRNTYKFDENSNKTEFSIYDWKTDKILETYRYIYNDKNEIIFVYLFDGNENLISKSNYSYNYEFDLKGNWTYSAKYINHTIQRNTETYRKIEYYE